MPVVIKFCTRCIADFQLAADPSEALTLAQRMAAQNDYHCTYNKPECGAAYIEPMHQFLNADANVALMTQEQMQLVCAYLVYLRGTEVRIPTLEQVQKIVAGCTLQMIRMQNGEAIVKLTPR